MGLVSGMMTSERSDTAQILYCFVKEGGWLWTSRLGVLMLACDGVRHGWMGRQLLNLFSEAGLSDIVVNGNVLSSDYAYVC